MKRIMAAVIVLPALAFVLGAAANDMIKAKSVTTERLVIVDANGKERAAIYCGDKQEPVAAPVQQQLGNTSPVAPVAPVVQTTAPQGVPAQPPAQPPAVAAVQPPPPVQPPAQPLTQPQVPRPTYATPPAVSTARPSSVLPVRQPANYRPMTQPAAKPPPPPVDVQATRERVSKRLRASH